MSNSTLPKSPTANEFGILFNESIIPQGLIQITPSNSKLLQINVLNTNKAFNQVANIKALTEIQTASSAFKFIDKFNISSITQFYLDNTQENIISIYHSQEKSYRLSLKKLTKLSILFSLEDITSIYKISYELNEKHTTEALSTSEDKYRTLIENADDGIGLFDMNFKPVVYNQMLYQMLGYKREEYLKFNHNKYELFHPKDTQIASKAIAKVKQGKHARIESRMRNKDGSYNYFAISYIPVMHEHKPAILIFRRNISKQKLAEQQSEEYRLFLETVMDNLPVSLFAKTTPDLRYLYWNKAIESLTGISSDDAVGKTDIELYQPRSIADKYANEDKDLLKYGTKLEIENEVINTRGEAKQLKTIKTIHKTSTGNTLILGISMDITKLKEAEKQIEQSTDMLKEAQKIAKLGYWEYDIKKDLLFENAENRQILGTKNLPCFINSYQFKELFYKEDKDTVAHAFKRCIVSKQSNNTIVRIKTELEIKYIAINYRPLENSAGNVDKLRGTCLDITHICNSDINLNQTNNHTLGEQNTNKGDHIKKPINLDSLCKKTPNTALL